MKSRISALTLIFLLIAGIVGCNLYEPDTPHKFPDQDSIDDFNRQFSEFEYYSKTLAWETQWVQQHECWQDLATALR